MTNIKLRTNVWIESIFPQPKSRALFYAYLHDLLTMERPPLKGFRFEKQKDENSRTLSTWISAVLGLRKNPRFIPTNYGFFVMPLAPGLKFDPQKDYFNCESPDPSVRACELLVELDSFKSFLLQLTYTTL